MGYHFTFDERLGISLPVIEKDWDHYSIEVQSDILSTWETIKGTIPDRIASIEQEINNNQAALENEENFNRSCHLTIQNAELASIINDLWIWYRTQQHLSDNKSRSYGEGN